MRRDIRKYGYAATYYTSTNTCAAARTSFLTLHVARDVDPDDTTTDDTGRPYTLAAYASALDDLHTFRTIRATTTDPVTLAALDSELTLVDSELANMRNAFRAACA